MHGIAQRTDDGHDVGPRSPVGDHGRKRPLSPRDFPEPAPSLPSCPIGLSGRQAEHAVGNAGRGVQRAHEEDQADIEGSQGVFRSEGPARNSSVRPGAELLRRSRGVIDGVYGPGQPCGPQPVIRRRRRHIPELGAGSTWPATTAWG